jgi:hypothetical protein
MGVLCYVVDFSLDTMAMLLKVTHQFQESVYSRVQTVTLFVERYFSNTRY